MVVMMMMMIMMMMMTTGCLNWKRKKYSHDSVKLHILNSTPLVVVRLPSLLNVRLMAAEFRNLQKK